MKLLKVDDNCGYYLNSNGTYTAIDKIDKDDLLRLVDLTLREQPFDMDDYDDKNIKNQAHQIIYKSVSQKLRGLAQRRQAFVDESARLYLEEYERYGAGASK